jgi:hypothetical protein
MASFQSFCEFVAAQLFQWRHRAIFQRLDAVDPALGFDNLLLSPISSDKVIF